MSQEVSARVIELIEEIMCYENTLPEHDLMEDVGCDELDLVELMLAVEEEFSIDLDVDNVPSTVQDLIELVIAAGGN
jgi:acyl carrier protein